MTSEPIPQALIDSLLLPTPPSHAALMAWVNEQNPGDRYSEAEQCAYQRGVADCLEMIGAAPEIIGPFARDFLDEQQSDPWLQYPRVEQDFVGRSNAALLLKLWEERRGR